MYWRRFIVINVGWVAFSRCILGQSLLRGEAFALLIQFCLLFMALFLAFGCLMISSFYTIVNKYFDHNWFNISWSNQNMVAPSNYRSLRFTGTHNLVECLIMLNSVRIFHLFMFRSLLTFLLALCSIKCERDSYGRIEFIPTISIVVFRQKLTLAIYGGIKSLRIGAGRHIIWRGSKFLMCFV